MMADLANRYVESMRFMTFGRMSTFQTGRRACHSGDYTRCYSTPILSEIALEDPREQHKMRARSLSPRKSSRQRKRGDLRYGGSFPRPIRYVFDASSSRRSISVHPEPWKAGYEGPDLIDMGSSRATSSVEIDSREDSIPSPILPVYYFPSLDGLKVYFSSPQPLEEFPPLGQLRACRSDTQLDRRPKIYDQRRLKGAFYHLSCRILERQSERPRSVESIRVEERSKSSISTITWDSGTCTSLEAESAESLASIPFIVYYLPALEKLKTCYSNPQPLNELEEVRELKRHRSDLGFGIKEPHRPRWNHSCVSGRVVWTKVRGETVERVASAPASREESSERRWRESEST